MKNMTLEEAEAREAEFMQEVFRDLCRFETDEECDVRLQLVGDDYVLHFGSSDYDLDHSGFWGASSISPDDDEVTITSIARSIVSQAIDQISLTSVL